MIEFDGVQVVRDGRIVLDDINLQLVEDRIGIIGANGSGKSTFARLLNGLQQCSRGEVRINGRMVAQGSHRVGFVFQNPDNQIVFPLVRDDLAFGLKRSGLSPATIAERVSAQLEYLGLAHLAERMTHELSGGEKQLVALAGVLVMEPECLVLDEPTTLLDLANRARIIGVLDTLDLPQVVVSHDLDYMATMQRLIRIDAGRVVDDGPPDVVIARYRASCT
ncbi:MAG: cobalt ABC transporter ATP-binding protein [Gammaproteobacteria bacterium]|nr:MAG: cobalt ABC transporter ATP-binding protein [Gammaproteobacteria bacterium]